MFILYQLKNTNKTYELTIIPVPEKIFVY